MEMKDKITAHYPNAATGVYITESYLQLLEKEYQTDLSKMLFATSVCSDDVNVSTDFRKVLKRPFTMGGMGGFPFTGLTGMVAFAHHIPDGGDAFIFYGPHIGITDEGVLGKMRRAGQERLTNSCGALMLALERFMGNDSDTPYIPQNIFYDVQQCALEQNLMPYKNEIITAKNPEKTITDFTYLEIDKQIKQLVQLSIKEFRCDRVFLLGGVVINTSEPYNDYVDVRNFEVVTIKDAMEFKLETILVTKAFTNL